LRLLLKLGSFAEFTELREGFQGGVETAVGSLGHAVQFGQRGFVVAGILNKDGA
jgi:hypothetical protein